MFALFSNNLYNKTCDIFFIFLPMTFQIIYSSHRKKWPFKVSKNNMHEKFVFTQDSIISNCKSKQYVHSLHCLPDLCFSCNNDCTSVHSDLFLHWPRDILEVLPKVGLLPGGKNVNLCFNSIKSRSQFSKWHIFW